MSHEAQCNYQFEDGGYCYLYLGHGHSGIAHLGLWWVLDATYRQSEAREAPTGERLANGTVHRPVF